MSEIKSQISEATKAAMRAREKARLAVLRMVNAEIKRVEVDERKELSDTDVLDILGKMLKQRQDALSQFQKAGRDDLADQETLEIGVIQEFLPEALSADELKEVVQRVIGSLGATSMKDMGPVMAALKNEVQGRADMGQLSGLVKQALNN